MKRIVVLMLTAILLFTAAFAEEIQESDYDIVTLKATSGKEYENIALLRPAADVSSIGDVADMSKLTGKVIPLADGLDAAYSLLRDKLHVSLNEGVYVAAGFYESHEVTGGYCWQLLIYMDSSAENYFDILVDMDGVVRQCDVHWAN